MYPNNQEEIGFRQFKFDDRFTSSIETGLLHLGYSLKKPGDLAKAVKKLSDFYIENPFASTPWHHAWAKAGYLAYFFPLNFLRTQAIVLELKRREFFKGLRRFIDFGCGLSAYPFLLPDLPGIGIDKSIDVLHLMEDIGKGQRYRLYQQFNGVYNSKEDLGIFSYVLTETKKLPAWAIELDSLLIVEPSTREDGRILLELRDALIDDGYFAWAPCTHQLECPLFKHSKRDWCHDRISVSMPSWYNDLEKLLPMKNKTVTFSYLAVRKKQPKSFESTGRVVGDLLDEKGKYRQLFCRGDKREFLTWMKKEHNERPAVARGQLLELPEHVSVSDELRVLSSRT